MGRIHKIEVVDYGAQGEYGLLGKVVCTSNTKDMTVDQVKTEIAELEKLFGDHLVIRLYEEVPAIPTT